MARMNLEKMSVADLVNLRDQIQAEFSRKIGQERAALQKQIDALSKLEKGVPMKANGSGAPVRSGRTARTAREPHAATGKKVQPKYRGPDGETWSGRGLAPRWLAALEADGKKRESYLIKK